MIRLYISPYGQLLNHKLEVMPLLIGNFTDMLKEAHFNETDVAYTNEGKRQLLLR
jgi:hypothetical protein